MQEFTPQQRYAIYSAALKQYDSPRQVITMCNALYKAQVELYGYPALRPVATGFMDQFPEVQKHKPRETYMNSTMWYAPYNKAERKRILTQAVKEAMYNNNQAIAATAPITHD